MGSDSKNGAQHFRGTLVEHDSSRLQQIAVVVFYSLLPTGCKRDDQPRIDVAVDTPRSAVGIGVPGKWLLADGMREHEETYYGRTLSEWVMLACLASDEGSARILGRIGPRSIKCVRELNELIPGSLPRCVISAIGSMGPEGVVGIDLLQIALASPDRETRQDAALAIGGMGERAGVAVPFLVDMAKRPIDGRQGIHGKQLARALSEPVIDRDSVFGNEVSIALVMIGKPSIAALESAIENAKAAGESTANWKELLDDARELLMLRATKGADGG